GPAGGGPGGWRCGTRPWTRILAVGSRAEGVARPGDHDDADVVVVTQGLEGFLEGNHHVERHRVHALGPVQRDEGDARARPVDQDEGHGGILRSAVYADPPRRVPPPSGATFTRASRHE